MNVAFESMTKSQLVELCRQMYIIRAFEEKIYYLFLSGSIVGTVHQYQGQEAVAVGVCAHLTEDDVITSTHRPHGHALAKGVSPRAAMAELFGKRTGCCHGKGGSMHLGDLAVGMIPAIAIVGGGIPVATGVGLSFKMMKEPRVAVCFFGDGASNEGAFHEGLNFAAVQTLPIVFVCENNLYGASTPYYKVSLVRDVADRAAAYGMPAEVVDGMEIADVYEAAGRAIERARSGRGPTLLECKTYRFVGHSRSDPAKYRPDEEEARWRERDPLIVYARFLVDQGSASEEDLARLREEVQAEIEDAVNFAQMSPDPRPEEALEGVFA